MSLVDCLSKATQPAVVRPSRVADAMDGIVYPPIELLYWIIRELKGNGMGPHVLDYFKHVSPSSLKRMGLALINRDGDSEVLLLCSICVNSAAFKFINTILSVDDAEGLEANLRDCAGRYLESVKLAMMRIQLLGSPSLLFLQSLLCCAFIAQGTGDSTSCWTFITTACRTCDDLDLESKLNNRHAETEENFELYYCVLWCHILDKNYTMMLGRSRSLLGHDTLGALISPPLNRCMSSLLSTYLHLVPVQALFIAELHPGKILNNISMLSRVESVAEDLQNRLQHIHSCITQLHSHSNSWDGLFKQSELSAIEFSYHSLRTSILRSRQICSPRKPTILYHPLTPFFVLFCHVVATSDDEDYRTLKMVEAELEGLNQLSPPIAKLQRLFHTFIGLCEGVVASQPIGQEHYGGTLLKEIGSRDSTTINQGQVDHGGDLLMDKEGGAFDSLWGLFDVQPTLDWLEADFPFFSHNE
ncbi:hypothetical protein P154DRAFT_576703 [Amniculicola lignicola CBS 123094]|uniref:Xylanolytic transcriptional activator regulatory domain-containing protein n=1 Tax=Amniculicola lignicola CBS 123094 TaxID=1392246 RepID=A0A6A5WFT2_9PLEO|nr:hypothetical protein P154DRAFT_576703 [Amniculicola lignicola CBS 123094]